MTAALTGYASRSWAALREAGSNPNIRRVVLAYVVFTVSKWALRIAKYVWLIGLGYAVGGVLGSLMVERTDIRVALVVAGAILPIVALLIRSRASRIDDEYVVPEAKLDVLRGLPMFAPLSLAALEHAAAGLTETRYPAAANIIREGDPGEALFVVIDGTAEVIERGQHQADLGPHTSFGEIALIRGMPSPATVRATTDVTLTACRVRTFSRP